MTPTVLLYLTVEQGKVQAKGLEEILKNHGNSRHIILFWLVQQL